LEATVFAFHWHAERHATESVGKRRTWIFGRFGWGLHAFKRGILCFTPSGFVNARTGVRGACSNAATVAQYDTTATLATLTSLRSLAAPPLAANSAPTRRVRLSIVLAEGLCPITCRIICAARSNERISAARWIVAAAGLPGPPIASKAPTFSLQRVVIGVHAVAPQGKNASLVHQVAAACHRNRKISY
jgi:hypothetical protein